LLSLMIECDSVSYARESLSSFRLHAEREEGLRWTTHTTEKGNDLPVDAGDVNDNINHVAGELVRLHVHRGAVSADVNLGHHVEQERLLDARILRLMGPGGQPRKEVRKQGVEEIPSREC